METLIGCAGGPDTISGWMRTNVRALYIFTRNQFASYLLSSGFEQLLPGFPGQGFVAGLLAEAATRLLSAGWRAWQRHRAKKLLSSLRCRRPGCRPLGHQAVRPAVARLGACECCLCGVMPHHLDLIIDAITKLLVGLITALLHRRLAQRPPGPPALPPAKPRRRRRRSPAYPAPGA